MRTRKQSSYSGRKKLWHLLILVKVILRDLLFKVFMLISIILLMNQNCNHWKSVSRVQPHVKIGFNKKCKGINYFQFGEMFNYCFKIHQ